nr:MAG TPA: hypothetical protein [Caudoviricetes sp.]
MNFCDRVVFRVVLKLAVAWISASKKNSRLRPIKSPRRLF